MSDIDDHLTNSKGNHRCNDYRGANNVCVWCEENEAARLELAALRAEIHTRGVTIDHLVAQADSYRAAIKAADEMRRCYSEVWSGNHEAPSIVAYSRARAEIGE